jgi:hypothetical protein
MGKEHFGLWTNWYAPNKADKKIMWGGNIDGQTKEPYFAPSQIGKQCKPVQVHSFSQNHLSVLLQKVLVGATSPIPFEHHLSMMAARSF